MPGWQDYPKTVSGTDSQDGSQSGMAGSPHSALRIRLNFSQVATSESGGDSSCLFSLQLSASLSIKGWTSFNSEILPYVVLWLVSRVR